MTRQSIPNKHLKSKEDLARVIVDAYLSNPSSMHFYDFDEILEGTILKEVNNVDTFGVVTYNSKSSWVLCTKSKESIISPSTYLGLPIVVERSDRVNQIAPGAGPLSSSSHPGENGSAGYTLVSGDLMVGVSHFSELHDLVSDIDGVIGTTTRVGPRSGLT